MPITTVTCLPPVAVQWQRWENSPIDPGFVTVFRLKLPDKEQFVAEWHSLLQPREQQRAARFSQLANRNAYILGRGLFRLIGSQLMGQSPQTVSIETTPAGKPFLCHALNWYLSVSHTGDWVVLAVGQTPVGVDVEYLNTRFIIDDLIPSVLTITEQRAMTESTNARLLFYKLWTRKEALVKATGKGIGDDFVNVPALEGTHSVDSQLIGGVGPWYVRSFLVADSYPTALANIGTSLPASPLFYEIDPTRLSHWVAVR